MTDFNTSLMREKFVIRDTAASEGDDHVIALSNRMLVPLIDGRGRTIETFVIRAQNMHTNVRAAARLAQEFQTKGSIVSVLDEFDWQDFWYKLTEGFEREHNPGCWIAVYNEGKCVFEEGEHHPFLDIIEKFDATHNDEYARSVNLAEEAFKQAGKTVKIEHETNVALVVSINEAQARCGIILRGAGSTATFNFTAKQRNDQKLRVSQCLSVSAAYLEGIQLAFSVGMGKRKLDYGLIEDKAEQKKIYDGEKRLGRLNHAILQFDQAQNVNYRPDRPDLYKQISDAEKFADKILKPQIEKKLASGELNEDEWVN